MSLLLAGCAYSPTETPVVNPDAFGSDMGTLVSISDIRAVAQEMIESLNASPAISKLRAQGPLKVLIGEFRQYTTITNFEKKLFLSRLISSINQADKDGAYRFLERQPVLEERALQMEGRVGAAAPPSPSAEQESGVPALRGAEFVLTGEIRELFSRSPEPGGGEIEKRTVQYSLRITRISDAAIVWSHAHEVVKRQVIGAVYR